MSIDAIKREAIAISAERTSSTSAMHRTSSTNTAADAQAVVQAVRDLQSHLSGMNPEYTVDYLSGLGIVRMRAASTGEVVFQVPDTEAVRLAQLIKDGVPLGALSSMKETA